MEMSHAIAMVRRDIGDPAETFLNNTPSDGMTLLYDLPQQNINPVGLIVQYVNNSQTINLLPTVVPGTQTLENPAGVSNFPAWQVGVSYLPGNQVSYQGQYYICTQANTSITPAGFPQQWGNPLTVYTVDDVNGKLQFNMPIPLNALLIVNGQAWGMFTDSDLESIVHDAVRQHCMGQTLTERYRNNQGFITYRDTPKALHNLPKMEETLVVTLADIDAIWILATDAASDVNVQTVEGTNIDRSARYQQYMTHIAALQEKYQLWCGQLGVGMFRAEVLTVRRVSRTNNRYVPIFDDREYDDHRYPVRRLPQIDRRDEDRSGVPSPIWNGLPL